MTLARLQDHVFILTGAGISAESGLGTFRDKDGLWTKTNLAIVATPQGFRQHPDQVHAFYNARRSHGLGASPNEAHAALARLETAMHAAGGRLTLVTQNVDLLHEKAGSQHVIHMHGQLDQFWCLECDERGPWLTDMDATTACPACERTGGMRPDIVWFGEYPYQLEAIDAALSSADLFVSIGTSGSVYPAAGYVDSARQQGIRCVEINLEPSENAEAFTTQILGPASQTVPDWVAQILARGSA